MTSSTKNRAVAHLRTLLHKAAPARLHALIHDPVDKALATMPHPTGPVHSVAEFHDRLGACLARLYRECGPIRSTIGQADARPEAIDWLSRTGKQDLFNGLDALWLEARQHEGGLRRAYGVLAEAFKTRREADYIAWLCREHCWRIPWEERVALVAFLLERLHPLLPAELHGCPPEQLADELEELVEMYIELQAIPASPLTRDDGGTERTFTP